jgi:hypothetical protein
MFPFVFDKLHSILYLTPTLVAPWGWVQFAAETRSSIQTNCVITWEYLRVKGKQLPIFFSACM